MSDHDFLEELRNPFILPPQSIVVTNLTIFAILLLPLLLVGGSLLPSNVLGRNNNSEDSERQSLAPPLEPDQYAQQQLPTLAGNASERELDKSLAPPPEPDQYAQQLPRLAPTHFSELRVTAGLVGPLSCYVIQPDRWDERWTSNPDENNNRPSTSILLRIDFRDGAVGSVTISAANNIPGGMPVPIARGIITEALVTREGFSVVAEETSGSVPVPRPLGNILQNCGYRTTPVSLVIEGSCHQQADSSNSRIRYESERSLRGTFVGQATCIPRS